MHADTNFIQISVCWDCVLVTQLLKEDHNLLFNKYFHLGFNTILLFIREIYDVSYNKDFIEGTKTKDEILDEFLDNFEGLKGNKDGNVTFEEWMDYYTDLSISIPSDDYFALMMKKVWGIDED